MPDVTTVLIVDDHQLVLDGLAALVNDLNDFELIGTANNGKEALKLTKALQPDIVLMDIDMPVMNGLEATARIKEDFKDTAVIILTMHNERSLIKKVMDLGADGYLLKNSDREDLSEALMKVASGKNFFSSDVALALLNEDGKSSSKFSSHSDALELSRLTEREIEILKLIADGSSNKEIADALFISHRTVDTHRTNLMKKLDIHNVAGLIKFAINNGLID